MMPPTKETLEGTEVTETMAQESRGAGFAEGDFTAASAGHEDVCFASRGSRVRTSPSPPALIYQGFAGFTTPGNGLEKQGPISGHNRDRCEARTSPSSSRTMTVRGHSLDVVIEGPRKGWKSLTPAEHEPSVQRGRAA